MDTQPAEHHIRAALTDARNSFDVALGGSRVDGIALKNAHCQFVIAVLLEELRRRDPERADTVTSWIAQAMQDGDVASELTWQWLNQIEDGHVPTGWLFDHQAEQPAMLNTWTFQRPIPGEAGATLVPVSAAFTKTSGLMVAQVARIVDGKPTISAGRWDVLDSPSGRAVVYWPDGWPFDVAQTIAAEFGKLLIDWYDTSFAELRQLATTDPDMYGEIWEVVHGQDAHRHCTDADHAVPAWRSATAAASVSGQQ